MYLLRHEEMIRDHARRNVSPRSGPISVAYAEAIEAIEANASGRFSNVFERFGCDRQFAGL